jgi:hypothetical protein
VVLPRVSERLPAEKQEGQGRDLSVGLLDGGREGDRPQCAERGLFVLTREVAAEASADGLATAQHFALQLSPGPRPPSLP